MSILESIKSERKLSFNYWRFRILHWAFSIENPDPNCPKATGLPIFLYTHYCPLFHLTNLIALLSPLILFVKFMVLIGRACGAVLDIIPFNKIFGSFKNLTLVPNKVTLKPTLQNERRKCVELICFWCGSFDEFWYKYGIKFEVLSENDAELIFNEYMSKIIVAREHARLRKEKWRQRIIFWTNFSRVFIKWAMNLAYIALAGLFLYGVYEFAGLMWDCLCWCGNFIAWLFTDAISFSFVLFLGKFVLWAGIAYTVIFFFIRLGCVQKFIDTFLLGIGYITPPFYIVLVPFHWIKSGWNNLCEFVSMFYEENCPPITLISEEEAVVESVAKGEEV